MHILEVATIDKTAAKSEAAPLTITTHDHAMLISAVLAALVGMVRVNVPAVIVCDPNV